MPELDGLMAIVARSSEGEKDDFLSKLPAIPVASIKTAAELDLASFRNPGGAEAKTQGVFSEVAMTDRRCSFNLEE
jgi:hypothetical protein